VERGSLPRSEGDKARALVNAAGELLKAVQAQVGGVADVQLKSAQANVAQRPAALAQARIDVSRTRITSPVERHRDRARRIERGQTVASQPASARAVRDWHKTLTDIQVVRQHRRKRCGPPGGGATGKLHDGRVPGPDLQRRSAGAQSGLQMWPTW